MAARPSSRLSPRTLFRNAVMLLPRTLAPILAGIALLVLAGWLVLTGGAPVESADAQGPTTAEVLAKAGAKEVPSNRQLTVEPSGYR
jgi:hypothetical protein